MSTGENPFRFLMRIVVFIGGIFLQSLFSCPRSGRSPPLIMIRWNNRKKMIEVPSLSVSKGCYWPGRATVGHTVWWPVTCRYSLGFKLAFLDCIWSVYMVISDDKWMMQLCEGCKDWWYIEKSIFLIFWVILTGLAWATNWCQERCTPYYVKSTIYIYLNIYIDIDNKFNLNVDSTPPSIVSYP